MYRNIGKTFKLFAKIIAVSGIVASVATALCLFASADGSKACQGWAIIVFGPVASWLLGLPMYAVGEHFERLSSIDKQLRKLSIPRVDFNKFEKLEYLLDKGIISEKEFEDELKSGIEFPEVKND